jgi:hypothetical protein
MITIFEILAMPVFGLGLLFGMDHLERAVAAGRGPEQTSPSDTTPETVWPLRTIPLTRSAGSASSTVVRQLVRSASDLPLE